MELEIMQYIKDGGIYALIVVALYLHRDLKQHISKKFDMLNDSIKREIDLIRRNGKR